MFISCLQAFDDNLSCRTFWFMNGIHCACADPRVAFLLLLIVCFTTKKVSLRMLWLAVYFVSSYLLVIPAASSASSSRKIYGADYDTLSGLTQIEPKPLRYVSNAGRHPSASMDTWRKASNHAATLYRNGSHSSVIKFTTLSSSAVRSVAKDGASAQQTQRVNGTTSSSCTSSKGLHSLLDNIVCSGNYLKQLVSASRRCNLFAYFDEDHVRSCGMDANGTYCRKHAREFPDPDYLAWDVLQKCTLQTKSGKCSSNCKTSLQSFASKFGCCIHVSRVSWFVEDNPHILILSSALWSFCGLTRPEPCGNVPSLPPSTIAGSCTYGCYAYARSALICEGVGSQLIETYAECGRKGSALELGQLCGINNNGMACFELQFSDKTDYLLSVYTSCFQYFSSGVCTQHCSSALKRFRNKYGCCVNVYNGTAFGDSSQLLGSIVTGYGLWSRCGIASPGMCSLPTEEETSGNRSTYYDVEAFCDKILTGGGGGGIVTRNRINYIYLTTFVLFVMYVFM